jgi:hypothetical protein
MLISSSIEPGKLCTNPREGTCKQLADATTTLKERVDLQSDKSAFSHHANDSLESLEFPDDGFLPGRFKFHVS